ncbi:hypothetical protein BDR26DRAFT_870187 [Obelidium mucronatum]|nr:hypothetical protein BDR26DRAFT_870187 [Obelidium mucronatum]
MATEAVEVVEVVEVEGVDGQRAAKPATATATVPLLDALRRDIGAPRGAAVVVAFEVAACANPNANIVRLHVDAAGCVDSSSDSDSDSGSNALVRAFNQWDNSRFASCQNTCKDAVTRISDQWSLRDPTDIPTRLAIYSPNPISECTALHLLTVSKFFGIPAPPATALDKSTIWNDDRVALLVADPQPKSFQCAGNVDSALLDLPIKDRSSFVKSDVDAECEIALDSLDWKLFSRVYFDYILHATDTPTWPSFSKVFHAYIQNPSTSTWNQTLGGLSCSDWSKWASQHPIKQTSQIPILNIHGPHVRNIYDLIHIALKLASSNPSSSSSSAPILTDAFLHQFSSICLKCRSISDLSLYKIYKAANDITSIPCKASVLGGRGDRLSEYLTRNRNELERVMLGMSSVATATLQVDSIPETFQRYYYDYEDEYWQEVDAAGAAAADKGSSMLGGLFGKELSDRGQLINVSTTETAFYFDRCTSTSRLQFSVPITLLNLKYTVGKHNLVPTYIQLSNNISIPYYESHFGGSSGSEVEVLQSYDKSLEFEGFEEGALFKFSPDGSHLEMDIHFRRNIVGRSRLDVGFSFSKSTKMDEFSINVICGYSPEVAAGVFPHISAPLANTLTDWFFANSESVMSSPIRYHVSTFDFDSKSINTPYLIPQLAFLTAQSPLIALQNARHLGSSGDSNPLQLPTPLAGKIAVTDACDMSTSTFSVAGGGRLVYRSDLMTVETCLESSSSNGMGSFISNVVVALAVGVEVPVVSLVTSKKDKNQKFVLINVNWGSSFNHQEAKLLLFMMEYFRVSLGYPIIVAGTFSDGMEKVMRFVLDETGLARQFFSPSKTGTRGSHVWAPFIPTSYPKRDPSIRHAPIAAVTTLESCLAPYLNGSESGAGSCDVLKEYGKLFRKAAVGGVVGEDRLLAKHKACASEVSEGGHLPVVYTLVKANEQISTVTFNIGGLSLSRLENLVKNEPYLFSYLAGFDVISLQTTRLASSSSSSSPRSQQLLPDPEEEYDSILVAEKLTQILTDSLHKLVSNDGKTRIKKDDFQFRHHSKYMSPSLFARGAGATTRIDNPNNLHIFFKDAAAAQKKGIPARLSIVHCSAEKYGASSSILGCLFQVKETEPIMIATLDDTVYNPVSGKERDRATEAGAAAATCYDPMTSLLSATGEDRSMYIPPLQYAAGLRSPLTNPSVDLPVESRGVMKRVYASLCLRRRRAGGGGGDATGTADNGCSKYSIPAVFMGSWGLSSEMRQKAVKLNGTFVEFRGYMDRVAKEIIRKNQVGDSKFPTGHNENLRVRAIVPSERVLYRDYLRLQYYSGDASSTGGGSFGWFSAGKGETQAQWPYWTDSMGHVSDYLVLFSSLEKNSSGSSSSGGGVGSSSSSSSSSSSGEEVQDSPDFEPEVPASLAYIDPFLNSPICNDKDTAVFCRTSAPACMPDRVVGGVGMRLDAGGRGGVGAADRRGWSLFGDGAYNGGGRFAAVCNNEL